MIDKFIIGNVTLYNADCRDLELDADVFISDPPYGIDFIYDGEYKDCGGEEYKNLLKVFCDKKAILLQYPEETMKYFCPLLGIPDDCIAWCYNSNTPRQFRLWSFFGIKPNYDAYKIKSKNPTDKRVSELVRSYDWFDDLQQVKNISKEKSEHPCQISVRQMERIVMLSDSKVICDPFMGSGSTGVACINLNKDFIGVEKSKKYFDIACERIEATYAQQRLFE